MIAGKDFVNKDKLKDHVVVLQKKPMVENQEKVQENVEVYNIMKLKLLDSKPIMMKPLPLQMVT